MCIELTYVVKMLKLEAVFNLADWQRDSGIIPYSTSSSHCFVPFKKGPGTACTATKLRLDGLGCDSTASMTLKTYS